MGSFYVQSSYSGGNVLLKLEISWADPEIGATSTSLNYTLKVYSKYNVSDNVNSFGCTIQGSSYSGSNKSIVGSNTWWTLLSGTKTGVAVSQTTTTTINVSGYLNNVEYFGNLSVSGSGSFPATGVPYTPITVSAGNIYFSTNTAQMTVYLSGGYQAQITKVNTYLSDNRTEKNKIVNLHLENTDLSGATTGTQYLDITGIGEALNYWDGTATDTTLIHCVVYCKQIGTTGEGSICGTLSYLPSSLSSLYSGSSFSAYRKPSDSSNVYWTGRVSANTSSSNPYYRSNRWPSRINVKLDGTSETFATTGISYRDATGNVSLSTASSKTYTFSTYRYTSFINSKTSFVSIVLSNDGEAGFIKLKRISDTSGNIGINCGTTLSAQLQIGGAGEATLSSAGHPFQIGDTSGIHLKMDKDEIQAVNNTSASTLYLNPHGGGVISGGDVSGNQLYSADAKLYIKDQDSDGLHALLQAEGTGIKLLSSGAVCQIRNGDDSEYGDLRARNIQRGYVSISPDASAVTGVSVSFSPSFVTTPSICVTANTSALESAVLSFSYSSPSTSGCTVNIYRKNTTSTGMSWIAVGASEV